MSQRFRTICSLLACGWALLCVAPELRADTQLEELPRAMHVNRGTLDGTIAPFDETELEAAPPPVAAELFEADDVAPPVEMYFEEEPPRKKKLFKAYHEEPWTWQILPQGIIYHSYLAGVKEPRMASNLAYERDYGWLWDFTIGGRIGILRYGTVSGVLPEGWELDVEGAAFPRLDLENEFDLVSADFRGGVALTYGWGPFQTKLAYYHISSHLGDEFMIRNPDFQRINYVRDAIVLGCSAYVCHAVRIYREIGIAFNNDGGSKPIEGQFGIEYSPFDMRGFHGTPFAAVNGYLREDVNFGGSFTAQAGWQWRSEVSDQLLRIGLQYFNGKSPQYEFFDTFEEQIGFGLWYDF